MADADTSKDPEVPLDDEAKKLKLDAIKAEARKTIAQAQKDTLAAQFPSSDVEAPEGKVDVGEKVGMVAQAVAYSAMADVAQTVADAVPANAAVLVVDDRGLFATDWQYEMVTGDLAEQKTALDEAVKVLAPPEKPEKPPAAPEGADVAPLVAGLAPALTVASSLAGGAAQLAGLFRSDYGLSALETKIESTPFIAAVTEKLLEEDVHHGGRRVLAGAGQHGPQGVPRGVGAASRAPEAQDPGRAAHCGESREGRGCPQPSEGRRHGVRQGAR